MGFWKQKTGKLNAESKIFSPNFRLKRKKFSPNFRSDGWSEDLFATSVKMSTYLVAFVVCDFEAKAQHSLQNHVLVRAFSRPEAVDDVDHALKTTAKMLD